ncbi:MAG: hypothetical protein JO097_10835, partial [Acidobacteriaceae bacterium]|nr:hypothetical protein [Acidobacteriaceae bacterium]
DNSLQKQYEGAYTLEKQSGAHAIRLGMDFIELFPKNLLFGVPTTSVVAPSVAALLSSAPVEVTAYGGKYAGASGRIPIGSLFLQDTFKFSERLTLLYGLRWEITHPSDSGYRTNVSFGPWNGPGTSFNPAFILNDINQIVNWPMRYGQIAPRLGLAYHLKRPDLIFRVGAGLFYDDALGSLIDPVNLSPLSWSFMPGEIGTNSLPTLGATSPSPTLFLPKVWEWRASAEKAVGTRSTASLSYIGSTGRKLLREETLLAPGGLALDGFAFASTGTSKYDALEAQLRGQLTSNLYAFASYTWGHSIDTGSQDSSIFWTGSGYTNAANRGSSSFDMRHSLSASATYRLPGSRSHGFNWWNGWNLSSTLTAHTGFPFDVTTVDRTIGLGFTNTERPDLVAGVPLWISNSAAPSGRELNPAAFQASANGANGTLGRNVLTGPGTFQVDLSLRRQFPLYRASLLEVSASAYNLFNRASFSNPVSYLGSSLFGQSSSMQSLMLGSGGPTSGLTPVFQQGGPRTVELGIKISF